MHTHVHWIDKVALHSGYVGDWEMSDGSVFEAHLTFDHATGNVGFCCHILVRQRYAFER